MLLTLPVYVIETTEISYLLLNNLVPSVTNVEHPPPNTRNAHNNTTPPQEYTCLSSPWPLTFRIPPEIIMSFLHELAESGPAFPPISALQQKLSRLIPRYKTGMSRYIYVPLGGGAHLPLSSLVIALYNLPAVSYVQWRHWQSQHLDVDRRHRDGSRPMSHPDEKATKKNWFKKFHSMT